MQHFGKMWQLAVICLMASFFPLTCVRFMSNDPTELTADNDAGDVELTPRADGDYSCDTNPVSGAPVKSELEAGSPTVARHTQHVDE